MAPLSSIVPWVSLKEFQTKSYVAYLGVWFHGLQKQETGMEEEGNVIQDDLSTLSLLWLISCSILWDSLRIHRNHISGSSIQRKKGENIYSLTSFSRWPKLSQFTLQLLSLCFSLCQRSSRIGSRDLYPRPEARPCQFASVGNRWRYRLLESSHPFIYYEKIVLIVFPI